MKFNYLYKVLQYIRYLLIKYYVLIFGHKFYDKRYFQSVVFKDIYSIGWRWAFIDVWFRRKFGINGGVNWPISPLSKSGPKVEFDIDDLGNFFQSGNYFQTIDGKIHIGKGTYLAKNIGIITTNHDLLNPEIHQEGRDVYIGKNCWIGMNSLILPGVILGDHTVVGAGSVVTHSFEDGYCVIAGNPAKFIKNIC